MQDRLAERVVGTGDDFELGELRFEAGDVPDAPD
jgi:hypothetical protein